MNYWEIEDYEIDYWVKQYVVVHLMKAQAKNVKDLIFNIDKQRNFKENREKQEDFIMKEINEDDEKLIIEEEKRKFFKEKEENNKLMIEDDKSVSNIITLDTLLNYNKVTLL